MMLLSDLSLSTVSSYNRVQFKDAVQSNCCYCILQSWYFRRPPSILPRYLHGPALVAASFRCSYGNWAALDCAVNELNWHNNMVISKSALPPDDWWSAISEIFNTYSFTSIVLLVRTLRGVTLWSHSTVPHCTNAMFLEFKNQYCKLLVKCEL